MHKQAESGEAAHAAYKGGLDANQAKRLQAWTHALQSAWQSQEPSEDQQLPAINHQRAWSLPALKMAARAKASAEELFRSSLDQLLPAVHTYVARLPRPGED